MNADDHWDIFYAMMCEFFALQGKRQNDTTIRIWWEALKDLTISQFQRGLEALNISGGSFPKPIDLRKAILGDERDNAREQEEKAEQAREFARYESWKQDPEAQTRDRARLNRIIAHQAKHAFDPRCETCLWEKANPDAHRSLSGGLFASEITWNRRHDQ